MNEDKSILFINTHYLPDYLYGGVVESGSKLFQNLRKISDSITISVVSKCPKKVYQYLRKGQEGYCYRSLFLHRWGFSLATIFYLWRDIKNCDVVLINGLFSFHNTLALLYTILLKKKFVISLRGGFEKPHLAQKQYKKKPYVALMLPLMKQANYIHVTSDSEELTAYQLGFNKVIKISNGIDVKTFEKLPDSPECDTFVFLFLSRTDKEKGLNILITAYRQFCKIFDTADHLLMIVGPDLQNHLKNMSINYEKENITYINGVYGSEKIDLIRKADVVLLPSYRENFGNIVAEALACEKPVITTTGTPWKDIKRINCGYYVKPDPKEFLEAMIKIYSKKKEELETMGKNGREYVLKNFDWKSKANELYKYLDELANEG